MPSYTKLGTANLKKGVRGVWAIPHLVVMSEGWVVGVLLKKFFGEVFIFLI